CYHYQLLYLHYFPTRRSSNLVAQDYGLFSRLALQYEVANLPEYLSEYRIHNSNITDRKKHLSKMQLKSILFEQLNKLLPNTKHIDRKSTRLNSSHVKISYAVL